MYIGHLVREIDALDGIIGKIADYSGIHFKLLNQRKGPAVQGPRLQVDRDIYKTSMYSMLTKTYTNIEIIQESVEDLILDYADCNNTTNTTNSTNTNVHTIPSVIGIRTKSGGCVYGNKVIITTGTFLRGTCYMGLEKYPAGRHMRHIMNTNSSNSNSEGVYNEVVKDMTEPPSIELAKTLERYKYMFIE